MTADYLTTAEAATRLGVSRARVLQLIADGRLPTERFGKAHMIAATTLDAFVPQPKGRPLSPDDAIKPASLKRRAKRATPPGATS